MPSAPSEQQAKKSKDHEVKKPDDQHQCSVSDQITDSVAVTNVATMGAGPGYSALQSMLGQTQSQNILMANMVSAQKQNAMIGMTTMTQSILKMMKRHS